MNTIHQEFIENVKKRCEAAGITPATACSTARLSSATWYNWQAGRSSPSAVDMQAVYDAITLQRKQKKHAVA